MNAPGRLTALMRSMASDEGWYALRDQVQSQFIMVLIGALLFATALGLYWARAVSKSAVVALLFSLLLITFILVRAVSLHAVDKIVFTRIAGATVSTIVEAGGVVAIFILALLRLASLRGPRPGSFR